MTCSFEARRVSFFLFLVLSHFIASLTRAVGSGKTLSYLLPVLDGLVKHAERISRADGTYAVTGRFSIVSSGGREYRYFDGTSVVRK